MRKIKTIEVPEFKLSDSIKAVAYLAVDADGLESWMWVWSGNIEPAIVFTRLDNEHKED